MRDIPINVLLQFVGTFAVWLIADRLGLSPIITMVAFAMTLSRRVAGRTEARRRIASYAVWEVMVLVLNVLAFVLIGLQLRGVVSRLHGQEWRVYALCAGAVCAAAIVVRITWTLAYVVALRWKRRRFGPGDPGSMPTYGNGILAAWCGMRGIVTLAAALALPDGPSGFPHRDIIVFSAFCVVLFTLVLQGLTLRPLMKRLGLRDDGSVDREIAVARGETARAALRALEPKRGASADLLKDEYQARAREEAFPVASRENEGEDLPALQRLAVHAQRESLRDLRARDVIGDDAFHTVEEEIDLLDLTADARVGPSAQSAVD